MKKICKFIPAALAVFLLVGCSTDSPKLGSGDKTIASVTDTSGVTLDTYQDVFDDLYAKKGVEIASKELLYSVAKYVLANSKNWTAAEITAEISKRIEEKFDSFYTNASYKINGLFDESKLVLSLQSQGYNVVPKNNAAPFEETISSLVGYKHLKTLLTYDYSEYEAELSKDLYLNLLNEEYILSQRANDGASTSYFTGKKVRKVEYFRFTPANSSEATKYSQDFEEIIAANLALATPETFKTLVTKDGGLEDQWKLKQLKDLAKDFAMINAKAAGYDSLTPVAVNEAAEYALPTKYATSVKNYELEYANDTIYGFRDIYSAGNTYDVTQKGEVKTKLDTYSSSGTKSIYKGYYLKQLDIITTNYFTEKCTTSDNAAVINSTVNTALEDMKKMYKTTGGVTTSYIDLYETDTAVFKADSAYYVMTAVAINDSSTAAEKKEAAKVLAEVSSNVKNAIYYYLTDLTEKGKLEINNQDIYDYLNETYNYGKED